MSKKFKLTFPKHFVVVIDKPLVTLKELGLEGCNNVLFTSDRFLPKILVDLDIFPSTSEVRRNRKELFVTFDKLDFFTLRFGHRIIDVVVGAKEDEFDSIISEIDPEFKGE